MGQININIEALDTSISELKAMQRNWLDNKMRSIDTVGGGSTVNQLEEIAELYEELNTKMGALLAGTISLLNKTKQEYEMSDLAMATKMKRE